MGGPSKRPTCKHGKSVLDQCADCHVEDSAIRLIVRPLVDEFWEHRGNRDLEWLMLRAYKSGMKHGEES